MRRFRLRNGGIGIGRARDRGRRRRGRPRLVVGVVVVVVEIGNEIDGGEGEVERGGRLRGGVRARVKVRWGVVCARVGGGRLGSLIRGSGL